jgi:hypothetical protein
MADRVYLSVWFPNFRLEALPSALVCILSQLEATAGASGVRAATSYPISWNESPVYQRIYRTHDAEDAKPQYAVAEATHLLHDDFAYEFEIVWQLWTPEVVGGLDPTWKKDPHVIRVTGFGPHFDQGTFEQQGHILIDFGPDSPFLEEEVDLDDAGKERVRDNLQKLVDVTGAIEKNCSISSRLLWTESGETLAEKLLTRLQRVN